jgi:hypothetical protein
MHHPLSRPARIWASLATSTILVLGMSAPIAAHVSIAGVDEVSTGTATELRFHVPHGCDGAATDGLEVTIPENVLMVQPAWLPGWTIETESVPSEPYMVHGVEQTERVGTVRWSGGSLPDELYLDFTLVATFVGEPSEVAFPVVQHCGDQEIAWVDVPGDDPEASLEHPAPTVTVVAGDPESDGHDHAHGMDMGAADGTSDLVISGAWLREVMVPGLATAAYLVIHNDSDSDDAVVGASSPAAAVVELHETTTDADGAMAMSPVAEVPIPAHGEAVFEPGGYHFMFVDPVEPLAVGDSVELTLEFAGSPSQTITVPVEAGAPMDEEHMHDHG